MADFSKLNPAILKPSVVRGADLKPAWTTDAYSGGTPTAADQIKPSLRYAGGTLKPALTTPDGANLKSSLRNAETYLTQWRKTAAAGWGNGRLASDLNASDFVATYVVTELTPATIREHVGVSSKSVTSQVDLEVSLYTGADGVYENAMPTASAMTLIVGDVITFVKSGTTVEVRQNGTLRHSMTLDSALAAVHRVGFDQDDYINDLSFDWPAALSYVGGEGI